MGNIFENMLTTSKRNRQLSGALSNAGLPGTAAKFVPGSDTKAIQAERGSNVSAKVPVGQPVGNIYLPQGLAIEDTVTVVIDTTSLGSTTATAQIVLFDEAKYFQAYNGVTLPFPANTVYINSAARNLYPCWVSGLCSQAYLFSSVKIDVAPASGAAATKEMQFQKRIVCHKLNTRTQNMQELPVSNYNDPANFDRGTYIIPLTDQKSRVDSQTAWVLDVYHGMVVTLTFVVQAYARD